MSFNTWRKSSGVRRPCLAYQRYEDRAPNSLRDRINTLRPKRVAAVLAVSLLIGAQGPASTNSAASQPAQLTVFTALSFYVWGHQDDWQLFQGNVAHSDLAKTDTRVVFIYATAGDAGRTDGWWEARERGAVASVRKAVGPSPLTVDVARFNDHPIQRYTCRNSV